ncbi:hypothetical protein [Stenotrophomonas sp.]|uniref:hypothetical protein n=1 Tax=Stenotrophomonas sp. TaxID=69392 RepID=UPI002FC81014
MPIIGSVTPNQRVAIATALNTLKQAFPLCNVRNGAGTPRTAPCGTSRTPGVHQQAVHAEALGAAIAALTEKADAVGTAEAERTALQQVVARLRDSSQPPLGTRVVNQLTLLGAVYAATCRELEAVPQDAAAQALKADLAMAIIGIGNASARCGARADGFFHGDKASKQLVAAIGRAQDALSNARATLGDQGLLNGMATTVMSNAMMASLNERLPHMAARFADATAPGDLLQVLQKQYAEETQNAMSRQLASGDPEDFAAAVFAFLKLPEYVVQASADKPALDTPPGLNVPDIFRDLPGMGRGASQAINYSPNTNVNDFGGFAGALSDSLRGVFNLGKEAGLEIGALRAEVAALRQPHEGRETGSNGSRSAQAGTHSVDGPSTRPPLSQVGDGLEWRDDISESDGYQDVDDVGPDRPLRNRLITDPDYLHATRTPVAGVVAPDVPAQAHPFMQLPRQTQVQQVSTQPFPMQAPPSARNAQPMQALPSTPATDGNPIPRVMPQPQAAVPSARDIARSNAVPAAPGTAVADDILAQYLAEINQVEPEHRARTGMRLSLDSNVYKEGVQRNDLAGPDGSVINPVAQIKVGDFLAFQKLVVKERLGESPVIGQTAVAQPKGRGPAPAADQAPDARYEFESFVREIQAPARFDEKNPALKVNFDQLKEFVENFKPVYLASATQSQSRVTIPMAPRPPASPALGGGSMGRDDGGSADDGRVAGLELGAAVMAELKARFQTPLRQGSASADAGNQTTRVSHRSDASEQGSALFASGARDPFTPSVPPVPTNVTLQAGGDPPPPPPMPGSPINAGGRLAREVDFFPDIKGTIV